MIGVIDAATLIAILKETAIGWSRHSEEVGQLDAIIGDGDMGVTVKLGSLAMTDFLAKPAEEDIGKLLMKCGMQINKASPSTFGTLLASAFMEAGKSALGRKEIEFKELALLGQGAIEGVKKRGKAKVGEKTMMDSLVPAVEAFECALTKGAVAKAEIESGHQSSQRGRKGDYYGVLFNRRTNHV
jgi:dihydroxyacetone kinase-like protein